MNGTRDAVTGKAHFGDVVKLIVYVKVVVADAYEQFVCVLAVKCVERMPLEGFCQF
jgi:hypothetical protein